MDAYDTHLTKRFREGVAEQIARLEKILATGKCASFEEYKAKCGEISGLNQALQILDETCQNAQKEGP